MHRWRILPLAALAWLTLAPVVTAAAEAARPGLDLLVGALHRLDVPHSKSDWVEVAVEGTAVQAVHDPLSGTVTLQGVHPGKARVRVQSTFARFRDPDARPRLVIDLPVQVSPAHARGLDGGRAVDAASVPAPRATTTIPGWEGWVSLQAEELTTVVADQGAWTALWRAAFAAEAPPVDFKEQVVACVFLGHQADWAYRIAFGEPRQQPGLQVIPYSLVQLVLELERPFQASGQYRLELVKRSPGRGVVVTEEGRER